MTNGRILLGITVALVIAAPPRERLRVDAGQAKVGSIKGRIRLGGAPPGNTVIRMRVDPLCAQATAGRRILQETVVTSADGGLANVFVRLQGAFPGTPVPSEPVTIDQRGCVYMPRVIGARVGQTLQIRNGDGLLHNVHSVSTGDNSFNFGQPQAGMVRQFQLKHEPGMLRLTCDVHRWMTAYIGVVNHPYFAVSGSGGTFEIANVPIGTHTIETWHERYGTLTQRVRVTAGAPAGADLVYTGAEEVPNRTSR